ncbi:unnamed protein product [Vitrella brassicaformis CCMP3155]|uniref:Sec-independent protein translocase protein TatC n=2 Tax=Vitrella brassicaformis TaxID=1169539 RepID=A0A0G4EL43_VITBC|nr:unnamed protein product [Vitrella brassicaformis CCMP3155]|eukprot:CEL97672.1 unnamed protein product [Vitrella brassicaformis CCMP3155]
MMTLYCPPSLAFTPSAIRPVALPLRLSASRFRSSPLGQPALSAARPSRTDDTSPPDLPDGAEEVWWDFPVGPDAPPLSFSEREVLPAEHDMELRDRLIFSGSFFGVLGLLLLFMASDKAAATLIGTAERLGLDLYLESPDDAFYALLWSAFTLALACALPNFYGQLIAYIQPSLRRSERQVVTVGALMSFSLLVGGIVFAVKGVMPFYLGVIMQSVGWIGAPNIEPLWSLRRFIDTTGSVALLTVLLFQLPILEVGLGLAGVLTSDKLIEVWRYVLVGSTLLSAVITPTTDAFTQIVTAGMINGLYGIGILGLKWFEANREKEKTI